jgi:uncharacterized protein (TIGR02246 family)
MIRRHARALVPAVALLAAAAVPTAAATIDTGSQANQSSHGCRASFDRAVRTYVQSTHDRDAKAFASVLHPDVTAIFADGEVMYGKKRTMAFIEPFFASTGWTQTFDELTREVRGCKTGFVLFDSVFTPSPGATPINFVIGVTFTYENGRWLALHNQDGDGPSYTTNP